MSNSSQQWKDHVAPIIAKRRAVALKEHAQATRQTPGSCKFAGCNGSRGKTICSDGQCICARDHCNIGGNCIHKDNAALKKDKEFHDAFMSSPCMTTEQTGTSSLPCSPTWHRVGNCHIWSCSASHGEGVYCSWPRCRCGDNQCAVWTEGGIDNGLCVNKKDL